VDCLARRTFSDHLVSRKRWLDSGKTGVREGSPGVRECSCMSLDAPRVDGAGTRVSSGSERCLALARRRRVRGRCRSGCSADHLHPGSRWSGARLHRRNEVGPKHLGRSLSFALRQLRSLPPRDPTTRAPATTPSSICPGSVCAGRWRAPNWTEVEKMSAGRRPCYASQPPSRQSSTRAGRGIRHGSSEPGVRPPSR
jgi:hypothetical protein